MILVADSGSTKTEWRMVDREEGKSVKTFKTQGINPFYQSEQEIAQTLEREVKGELKGERVDAIYFYGAGVTKEKESVMAAVLKSVFESAEVHAGSDLLGAAWALLGKEAGIACIMGTGSNSCFYDGERIVENVPALGYVLGDEGSGAVIGKRLIGDLLKRQMPAELIEAFGKEHEDLTQSAIIEAVYRKPYPNRFLAQFTHFVAAHRTEKYMQVMLQEEFGRFLRRNVMQYDYERYAAHFVGSVASVFEEELRLAAEDCGVRVGTVLQAPMDGMVKRVME